MGSSLGKKSMGVNKCKRMPTGIDIPGCLRDMWEKHGRDCVDGSVKKVKGYDEMETKPLDLNCLVNEKKRLETANAEKARGRKSKLCTVKTGTEWRGKGPYR